MFRRSAHPLVSATRHSVLACSSSAAATTLGDISFTSLRREYAQIASRQGVKVFAYLFTDPQNATVPAYLGAGHGSDKAYVYGVPENGPASVVLSQIMIDYWVSFATNLDPNDGHRDTSRPVWTQCRENSQAVLELDSSNVTMIPDTFRADQISFLNGNPETFPH